MMKFRANLFRIWIVNGFNRNSGRLSEKPNKLRTMCKSLNCSPDSRRWILILNINNKRSLNLLTFSRSKVTQRVQSGAKQLSFRFRPWKSLQYKKVNASKDRNRQIGKTTIFWQIWSWIPMIRISRISSKNLKPKESGSKAQNRSDSTKAPRIRRTRPPWK